MYWLEGKNRNLGNVLSSQIPFICRKEELRGQEGTELWRPTACWEVSQRLLGPLENLYQLSLPRLRCGRG